MLLTHFFKSQFKYILNVLFLKEEILIVEW